MQFVRQIHHKTPAVLSLHSCKVPINPTKMDALSPTPFLLYYDSLLRETLTHHPVADLYVFVDDIAVKANYPATLTKTLNHLRGITP